MIKLPVEGEWDWNVFVPADVYYRFNDEFRFFVKLRCTGDLSWKTAVAFDDIGKSSCSYRNWTRSALPFVDKNEVYYAGFWFTSITDYEQFKSLYRNFIYEGNMTWD